MRDERGERIEDITERSPRSFLNTENASHKKTPSLPTAQPCAPFFPLTRQVTRRRMVA